MSACGGGSGCSPALSLPTALGCLSRLTWLRSPASGPQAPPSARPRRGPVACGVHVVPGAVPASDRSPTRSHHPEWHTHDSGVPVGWPRGLCTSPAGLSAHANSPGLTRQVRAGSLSTRAPPARLTLRQVRGADSPIGSSAEGFSEHTPRPGDVIAAAGVCGPLGKPAAIIGARAQPGPRVKRPELLN